MPLTITQVVIPLQLDDSDVIGMTFSQPHLPVSSTPPYKIAPSKRAATGAATLNCIRAAFENIIGLPRSNFVVFPEFSLPHETIPDVEELLRSGDCPQNTVVIAGVEWLAAQDYAALLASSSGPEHLKTKIPANGSFVNCIVVWFKTADSLLRYLQPKLRPSAAEAAPQQMYKGDDVLVFVTSGPNPLSFASLVCFDCIAMAGQTPMFDQILSALPATSPNTAFNLNLLFIPQHNAAPEHPDFLDFATQFLNNGGVRFNTADSTVAFVNSAAKVHGRTDSGFGRSSLFYRSNKWQPIREDGPLNLVPHTYALEILSAGLMRGRFREDGPGLHRFGLVLPWRVTRASGASRLPLVDAKFRRIEPDGSLHNWENIPALSQVFSDWLPDDLPSKDARFHGTEMSVADEYSRAKAHLYGLTRSDADRVGQITDILLMAYNAPCCRPKVNPDFWQKPVANWRDEVHGEAIVELAITCSVLQLLDNVNTGENSEVKTGSCGGLLFAIIDGFGQRSHTDLVAKYFEWLETHSWADLAGRKIVLIFTRPASLYLTTTNNAAEEIKAHIGQLSAQDESSLHAISPDLVTAESAITEDGTHFFKQFSSILLNCVSEHNKAEAATFLRQRLGQAI